MNNRQKAKHFKKLYEQRLPKKPYPVVYSTMLPKHYRIQHLMDVRDVVYVSDNPSMLKTQIENGILRKLRPLICDNLKTEIDIDTGKYKYSLDVWIESR